MPVSGAGGSAVPLGISLFKDKILYYVWRKGTYHSPAGQAGDPFLEDSPMASIWSKCPRNRDVELVEAEVRAFLVRFGLEKVFLLDALEEAIYNCPPGCEDTVFSPILARIKGGTLADLVRFDALFRQKFTAHIPQKVLGGLSPVKYALFLKKMHDEDT